MNTERIVFMGTPNFAVPSLKILIENNYNIVGVVCQPDRPQNRGHKISMCPVKEEALKYSIPVFQPERIKSIDGVLQLKKWNPDLCVTAAFGQLLSKENLEIPRLGTINVHASLLPKHRGSAPVNWSILLGDNITGVTTMMTDIGMDTGDILLSRSTAIMPHEDAGQLSKRLSLLGAEVLLETIKRLFSGKLERFPQNESLATKESKLTKEMGKIDWKKTSYDIDLLIRGVMPWPSAYSVYDGQSIKIFNIEKVSDNCSHRLGEIVKADTHNGLVIQCKDGQVLIKELQMPGSKRMSSVDYLRGHYMKVGNVLGGDSDE